MKKKSEFGDLFGWLVWMEKGGQKWELNRISSILFEQTLDFAVVDWRLWRSWIVLLCGGEILDGRSCVVPRLFSENGKHPMEIDDVEEDEPHQPSLLRSWILAIELTWLKFRFNTNLLRPWILLFQERSNIEGWEGTRDGCYGWEMKPKWLRNKRWLFECEMKQKMMIH